MENDILKKLKMKDRNEVIHFLKQLWNEEPTSCPNCGETLEHMHKKAKKSNCDWKCPNRNIVYKTIHILDELNKCH